MLHYVFASFFKWSIIAATDMNSEEKDYRKTAHFRLQYFLLFKALQIVPISIMVVSMKIKFQQKSMNKNSNGLFFQPIFQTQWSFFLECIFWPRSRVSHYRDLQTFFEKKTIPLKRLATNIIIFTFHSHMHSKYES